MAKPFEYGAGSVVSADIAVPQHMEAVAFYSSVLGTGDHPLWREDLMNSRGTPIIGVGKRTPEYAHLPLQWMPHIQVADVAASVESALARGGRELMHSQDEGGTSEWAVLLDPDGAAFGLIPVVSPLDMPPPDPAQASDDTKPVGRISWLDLTVPDAEAARDFYEEVVGWSARDVQMEDAEGSYFDYAFSTSDGTSVAGVCHARGVNRDLPATWMIYLPVGDLVASLDRVAERSGEVIHTKLGGDGEHSYAVVRDPAGAYVGLVPG
ncbi:MAG: VOC family protein [Gemmatimonadetes bacterium]|nr:VOC family protein [Gemmatimonadota bacterium]